MRQNASWLIWNKAGLWRISAGLDRAGGHSEVRKCALTIHDCLVSCRESQADHGGKRSGQSVSNGGTRSQRLIRRLRMPAETILAFGWRQGASLCFDLTDQAVDGLVRRAGVSRSKNNPIKRPRMPQIEPQWKRSKMAMKGSRTPAGLTWCVCNGSSRSGGEIPHLGATGHAGGLQA